MTTGVVLDASTTLAWAFDDESGPYVDRVLDHVVAGHAVVPAVWSFEVANGVAVGLRRDRISATDAERFLNDLQALDIRIEHTVPEPLLLVADAVGTGLTAYDAVYVAIARSSGLPLASRDRAMVNAARAGGVVLFT